MSSDQTRVLQIYPAFFGGASLRTVALPADLNRLRLLRWIGASVFAEASIRGSRDSTLMVVRLDAGGRIETPSDAWQAPGSLRDIDVSPDGRAVALTRAVDGREDLWTCLLDGGSPRQLTHDDFFERYPIWDGTGSRIIFQSNRGGQLDLWEVDPASGRLTVLTSGEMEKVPESTSPDGSIVTFQRQSQEASLWLWDPRTGAERQITQDALGDYSPSASRDGRVIAFQRSQPIPSFGYTIFDSKLQVGRLDDEGTIRDVRSLGDAYAPHVSPDGAWIAYMHSTGSAARTSLSIRNLSTGAVTPVSDSLPLPALSLRPVDWVNPSAVWSSSGDLWFIERRGHELAIRRQPTSDAANAETVAPIGPADDYARDLRLSPDDRRAAWLHGGADLRGFTELRALDIGSRQPRVLARFESISTGIVLRGWLDGGLLVVRRTVLNDDFSGDAEVLHVHAATGAIRRIGAISRVHVATARLDAERRVLYVTRNDKGALNLYEYSTASGALRPLTRNTLPGVAYSGYVPLAAGTLVGVREERRQDLWLIQPAPPPSGNPAGP
jgi:Tol biopolymer transport system component